MNRVSTEHAAALLAPFIAPERRARFLTLLGSARGRAKLRAALAHFRDLDPDCVRAVPASAQDAGAIAALLRARGAPERCYVLSEDKELDGRELRLDDALARVVGGGAGTLLSCVPGRVGYYEGEEPGRRFVLLRAAV
jgi:hypothetical protein